VSTTTVSSIISRAVVVVIALGLDLRLPV
jgi:hypothetical protein